VVGMDRCEEDMISVACGLHLLSEEKLEKRKYSVYNVLGKRSGSRISHFFERLKDDTENFFKYFRVINSKSEKLKQLLHTDIA
jgi:hypothetical protein